MKRLLFLTIVALISIGFIGCSVSNSTLDQANIDQAEITVQPDQSDFLIYADMARNNESLPLGISVSLNPTPNGGTFSVMFSFDGNGNLVDKNDAVDFEIHECDSEGNSISRTYSTGTQ